VKRPRFVRRVLVCLGLFSTLLPATAGAADWPMERHDARRSASSPQELTATLSLQWVRHDPPLRPAWPDQPMMQFDAVYSPIVHGKTMLVGSPRDDSITALDTETGAEVWKFFTDGPVRFAPAAWEGRVYATSDDGYLYCLDAVRGALLWKFRGGFSERKVLGNGRLISTWPARGGPVVADGKVYFAAGIWPFMGVALRALDARTGEPVWTNDGDGSLYMAQPHHADAFAGVAPQGALVVTGDRLLIPGGRSVPACYDCVTGKLLHYRLADNSQIGGCADVAACDRAFVNGSAVFDLATGDHLDSCGKQVVLEDTMLYTLKAGECRAWSLPQSEKLIEARPQGQPRRADGVDDGGRGHGAYAGRRDTHQGRLATLRRRPRTGGRPGYPFTRGEKSYCLGGHRRGPAGAVAGRE
jgi:outer membrane protein assembly factor BamB